MRHVIRRKPWLVPLFLIIGVGAIALFGWAVMALWNAALVPATGAAIITFWQAMGLLVLSRILVGGFSGKGGGHRGRQWKEKWTNMTTEEKNRFQDYCRSRWGKGFQEEQQPSSTQQ